MGKGSQRVEGILGERAISTTRLHGRWEEDGPLSLRSELGASWEDREKGGWTIRAPFLGLSPLPGVPKPFSMLPHPAFQGTPQSFSQNHGTWHNVTCQRGCKGQGCGVLPSRPEHKWPLLLTLASPAWPRSPASVAARARPGGHHTKTLARASAPALAIRALLG